MTVAFEQNQRLPAISPIVVENMQALKRKYGNYQDSRSNVSSEEDEGESVQPSSKRHRAAIGIMTDEEIRINSPSSEQSDLAVSAKSKIHRQKSIPHGTQQQNNSLLQLLPVHLLTLIFSFFSQPTILATMSNVSKRWYYVSKFQSSSIWKVIDFNKIEEEYADSHHCTAQTKTVEFTVDKMIQFLRALTTNSLQGSLPLGMSKYVYQQAVGLDSKIIFSKNHYINSKTMKKIQKIFPNVHGFEIPALEKTSTSSHRSITDETLKQMSNFASLDSILVTGHSKITDGGVLTMVKKLVGLLTVKLDYCVSLTAASLRFILQYCPVVRSLSLLGIGEGKLEKHDILLLSSVKSTINITELRVEFGKSFDSEAFQLFVQQFKKLKHLSIRCFGPMDTRTIQLLCGELYDLETLQITCIEPSKIHSAIIESYTLKSLQIQNCDGFMNVGLRCPKLSQFSIEQCKEVRNIDFSQCRRLQELRMRSCTVSCVEVGNLFGIIGQIRELELFDCKFGSSASHLLIDSTALQKLVLFMCNDIKHLELQCPNLTSLNVDVCMELQKMFIRCPLLESMQIFVLPQMQQPKLSQLSIESQCLSTISLQRTPQLQSLSLVCPRLDSLNLSGCRDLQVIDTLVCPILDKLAIGSAVFSYDHKSVDKLTTACPSISMLSITNSQLITDAVIGILCTELRSLQALVVSNCSSLQKPSIRASLLKGVQVTECPNMQGIAVESESLSKIFFRNCNNIKDDTISGLSRTCPNLKFLEVFNCTAITKPYISFPNLTDLHFNKCENLKQPILSSGSIKKLLFVSCELLNSIQFERPCPNISEILFSDCPNVDDTIFAVLQSNTANVQAIVCSKCDSIKSPVITLPALRVLRFSECFSLEKPTIIVDWHKQLTGPSLTLQCNTQGSSIHVLAFQDCPLLEFDKLSQIVFPRSPDTGKRQQSETSRLELFLQEEKARSAPARQEHPTDHSSIVLVDQLEVSQCDGLNEFIVDLLVSKLSIANCDNINKIAVVASSLERMKLENLESLLTVECIGTAQIEEFVAKSCPELSVVDMKPVTPEYSPSKQLNTQVASRDQYTGDSRDGKHGTIEQMLADADISTTNGNNYSINLKKLEFSHCYRVSDLCITSLLSKCRELEHLEIVDCGITNPIIVDQMLAEIRKTDSPTKRNKSGNISFHLHQQVQEHQEARQDSATASLAQFSEYNIGEEEEEEEYLTDEDEEADIIYSATSGGEELEIEELEIHEGENGQFSIELPFIPDHIIMIEEDDTGSYSEESDFEMEHEEEEEEQQQELSHQRYAPIATALTGLGSNTVETAFHDYGEDDDAILEMMAF